MPKFGDGGRRGLSSPDYAIVSKFRPVGMRYHGSICFISMGSCAQRYLQVFVGIT